MKLKNSLEWPLTSFPCNSHSRSHTHSPSFLDHRDADALSCNSDIEMISLQPLSYTSLKDLLPASHPAPAPPAIVSPTTHNSSWHEIPIRNPLVKQAALAYLQPMSTPTGVGNKGPFGKLKDACCSFFCDGGGDGGLGCFGWLGDVVSAAVKAVFGRLWDGSRRLENGEVDDDDDDDDDKVD